VFDDREGLIKATLGVNFTTEKKRDGLKTGKLKIQISSFSPLLLERSLVEASLLIGPFEL
jgi:hypothetical protein